MRHGKILKSTVTSHTNTIPIDKPVDLQMLVKNTQINILLYVQNICQYLGVRPFFL